jgi:hypothetical protein
MDPQINPETDLEIDLETDPELDPEIGQEQISGTGLEFGSGYRIGSETGFQSGLELDPDSELYHGNQCSKLLQIAKSAVALASGLPQFNNKLRNSGLWHSLKCLLLALAIRSMAIFLVAIRRVHTVECQDLRYLFERGA